MKRLSLIVILCILITGCDVNGMDVALQLRERLQNEQGCTFSAQITADYVDLIYEFEMKCQADNMGNVTFTVISPESISGISGILRQQGGALDFDDQLLAFEMMADGQIIPVSAPWILIQSIRSGYIRGCTKDNGGTLLVIDDTYEEDAFTLNVWLDDQSFPCGAEIFWQGRRIMTIEITSFCFL